jgi:hypothetical protein
MTPSDGPLHPTPIGTITPVLVGWPPLPPGIDVLITEPSTPPPLCLYSPLPLSVTDTPQPNVVACAAHVKSQDVSKAKKQIATDVVTEYLIGSNNMAMIYISPDPFGSAFKDLDPHNLISSPIVPLDSVSLIKTSTSSWPPWLQAHLVGMAYQHQWHPSYGLPNFVDRRYPLLHPPLLA